MGSEGSITIISRSRVRSRRGARAGFDVKVNEGVQRDWANDLVDKLETLQEPDGQFRSVNKRWMEDNPVLITAYSPDRAAAQQESAGRGRGRAAPNDSDPPGEAGGRRTSQARGRVH